MVASAASTGISARPRGRWRRRSRDGRRDIARILRPGCRPDARCPMRSRRSRSTGGSLARMFPIDQRAASSRPRPWRRPRSMAAIALTLGIAILAAGCADNADNLRASPTPADFGGIVNELARVGIHVNRVVSGDAGCADATLAPTAIGFDAFGLDQPASVRIHLYAFKDASTFDRLRASVDTCAQSFVTDP